MQLDFIIRQWAVWSPLDDSGSKSDEACAILSAVPKMLKRRLSALAGTVFCAAIQCRPEGNGPLPMVFSSSHGELAKSFAMMEMLEAGEAISPTAFSLSVHNAVAGLFAIACGNQLQSTVLAPGEEGMAPAFLEALGLLQEGAEQVLLVFYDAPVVTFYPTEPYHLSTEQSCALALRIANTGAGLPLTMTRSLMTGDDGEQALQVPAFVRFLAGARSTLTLASARRGWHWEKRSNTVLL